MENTLFHPRKPVDPLLTVDEIARQFNMAPTTIYAFANQGYLKCIKFRKSLRFRRADVDKFIEDLEKHTYGKAA